MSSSHFIHEGRYAAEVEITLIDDETPWAPIVAKEDVFKTDRVRLALRRGDIKAAAKEAKVFELLPLAGE
jgi:predicted transcriptional regulator